MKCIVNRILGINQISNKELVLCTSFQIALLQRLTPVGIVVELCVCVRVVFVCL